jgi:hypothetical protein
VDRLGFMLKSVRHSWERKINSVISHNRPQPGGVKDGPQQIGMTTPSFAMLNQMLAVSKISCESRSRGLGVKGERPATTRAD